MNDNTFLWILLSLLAINTIAFVYYINALLLNKTGLLFLEYAKGIISKNDEPTELDKITNVEIPMYTQSLGAISNIVRIILITIFGNAFLFIFSLIPNVGSTLTWNFLTVALAFSNAFIITSFNGASKLKRDINITCESYSMLLKSFEYEKEYEDKDNDSPK